MRNLISFWPLLTAFTILLILLWIVFSRASLETTGTFVYALDDVYIHMAIAKHFVENGVWGVTQYEFSSSSSSIIWPVILSFLYAVFGVVDSIPLILNIVSSFVLLFVVFIIGKKNALTPLALCALLYGIVLFTPLMPLVASGMEHTLQIAGMILFIWMSSNIVARSGSLSYAYLSQWVLCGMLVVATRYEGIFIVGLVTSILLYNRKFRESAASIVILLPIVLYGIWSVVNGWYFLPNSILIKGSIASDPSVITHGFAGRIGYTLLLAERYEIGLPLLFVVTVLLWKKTRVLVDEKVRYFSILVCGATLAHLAFSTVGGLYRYEAYIIALLVLAASLLLYQMTIRKRLTRGVVSNANIDHIFLAIVLVSLFVGSVWRLSIRSVRSYVETVNEIERRYIEQITTMGFLKAHYPASAVVLSDFGAVSYYTDVYILDLVGLGSKEPYEEIYSADGFRSSDVQIWADEKGAEIAIVKPHWFGLNPLIPETWIELGRFEYYGRNGAYIDKNVVYATAPEHVQKLSESITLYSDSLPSRVRYIPTGQ